MAKDEAATTARPASPDLWARFDTRVSPSGAVPGASSASGGKRGQNAQAKPSRWGWVLHAILPLTLTLLCAVAVLLPASLPRQAKVCGFGFALAVVLWSTTKLNAAFVALSTVLLVILLGGAKQEKLFDALASDVVWLMIGAFVLGAAVEKTGLAARLTGLVVRRARTVRGTFWLLTFLLVPLTFFIPSTSGRAAVTIPVFRSIAAAAGDPKITRALALLMPTVILVATMSTLIGAGSHLIANDLLFQIAKKRVSFAQWAMWGVPFGLAASALACAVVSRLFLDKSRLDRELPLPEGRAEPFSRAEWMTLGVVALMVAGWVSESRHGLEIATVTVLGALVLMLPGIGVLSWKDGLKSVSWNLILFVGAALVLGRALIESGAAKWIIDNLFAASGLAGTSSRLMVLVLLCALTLTSHIYMTSHTARAAALVPPLLYLGSSLELNPVAVMFIGTVGMDYCLTFPVSSKALLMFQELEGETYQPADLLKLSAILLPLHLILMVAFYFAFWRHTGLRLSSGL